MLVCEYRRASTVIAPFPVVETATELAEAPSPNTMVPPPAADRPVSVTPPEPAWMIVSPVGNSRPPKRPVPDTPEYRASIWTVPSPSVWICEPSMRTPAVETTAPLPPPSHAAPRIRIDPPDTSGSEARASRTAPERCTP